MERNEAERALQALRAAPLFRGLRARRLRQVLAASRLETDAPGAVILRQGAVGDAFYVVIAGQVAVQTGYPSGESTHLARLGPGQCFGEMILLVINERELQIRLIGIRSDGFSTAKEALRVRVVIDALVGDAEIEVGFEIVGVQRVLLQQLRYDSVIFTA